ncbi:MAG: DnaJ C-terminal domain-containing protein [Actinomycetota bacterium]
MRDPYDILGVPKTAGEAEIRKAFRKLAKEWHPDMKPGDKTAEARFREINAAYDLLSDKDKRARFDRGEIDAEGRERYAHAHAGAGGAGFGGAAGPGGFNFHFGGGGPEAADMEDLFSHLFGQGAGRARGQTGPGAGFRMRGEDLRHALTVDFLDAANGATRRITLPDGRALDVSIPAGINDGQTLRLKGQGAPGLGGDAAGDLLLEVRVAPHRLFTRTGNDIRIEVPVSPVEAVDGGRITVPTVSGPVAVTVPRGANTGTVLRLKGKGVKGGDQYVTLKVVLPPGVDDELAATLRAWSARHPFDPRAGL